MKTKKKRTRKIKRPSSGKKPYFTPDTQEAIMAFCSSDDFKIRSELYNSKIKPALEALAENLIYVYGFHKQHDDIPGLKHACVIFLYETLHKFDHSRGSNAFSYFNVVGKNWLIIQTRKKNKNRDRLISIDDKENLSSRELSQIARASYLPSPQRIMEKKENTETLHKFLIELRGKAKNDQEKICVEAIITVFTQIDQLDFLNKRAIFVYVRDISGLNSKQLSSCMSSIRMYYKQLVGPNKKYDIF